jgi:hypothetical protein
LAAVAGAAVWWVLFLSRVLAIKEEESPDSEEANSRGHERRVDRRIETAELPFGQVLMAGRVESTGDSRRHITVNEVDLRFWGGYALRSGWIRSGDWIALVYQKLFGLNYVMVFWKGADTQIRKVGTGIHAFFLVLAIGGMTLIPALNQSYPIWFVPACAMLFIVSSAYLLLVIRAKRALHDGISGSVD